MDAGSGNLQSGFVLAAIVVAVLFADRIGGQEQLARRLYQVALAVTLTAVALSATAAFVRPPTYPKSANGSSSSLGSSSSSSENEEQLKFFRDVANRDTAANAIHFGAGAVGVVLGIAALRRFRTLGLAITLAGVLLILFGGVRSGVDSGNPLNSIFSAYTSVFSSVIGSASRTADIARFGVAVGAAIVLVMFGLWQYDATRPDSVAVARPEPPSA